MPAFNSRRLPRSGYGRHFHRGLEAAIVLSLTTYVITKFIVPRPTEGHHPLLDGVLYSGVLILITVNAAAHAVRAPKPRTAHASMAAAIASWSIGSLLGASHVRHLDSQPWPSVADGLWLGFYPFAVVAVICFLRHQAGTARLGLWLDGLVGGLAVAALGSALFLQPIIDATTGSAATIAVNLAYPLGDLLVLLLVVGAMTIIGRWSRWWATLGAGLGVFAVGDTVSLFQTANETYHGGVVDLSWIVALAVLGVALPNLAVPRPQEVARTHRTLLLPVTFSVVALMLVAGHEIWGTSYYSFALAVAALGAALPLLVVAGREVRTLQGNHQQARTDELTGLANRRYLNEVLPRMVADATGTAPTAMLVLDLDGFKEVNDSLGHDAGDRLLVQVAGRLRRMLEPTDLLVRLGGDEFAVIRPHTGNAEDLDTFATTINRTISEPIRLDAATVAVGGSIGIALAPHQATTPGELFRKADAAMYTAKRARLGHARFEDSQDQTAALRADLAFQVVTGLDPDQFQVYYQPVMDLGTDQTSGAEALIRWHHPTRGKLAPVTFLSLVNELGANPAVTNLVLDKALAAAANWQQRISPDFTMAVNITSADVQDHGFAGRVALLIARHRVNPRNVILEVTESTLLSDISTATDTLQGLRNLGLRIALDDFGTGYSSLSHLRDLPIDQLKLDRSFITGLVHDPVSEAIVRSVVGLAAALNLSLVAEGIEQQSTATAVAAIGCAHAQGFLWSQALTVADFEEWRQQRSGPDQPSRAFLNPLMAPA
ncbi:MAG: putative bifunctional diguanylate cyclase/phosphodiesterase [Acidimicrobiales bacterium]